MDKYTMNKTMLRYERLLIEVTLGEEFPDYVEFANDKNVIVRQPVHYEWKPIQCKNCKMCGHTKDNCRKKASIKKVWRVV